MVLGLDGIADFNALHSRKHDQECITQTLIWLCQAVELATP